MRQKQTPEEAKRKARAKRLWESYGVTLEEWERMFNEQKGVCWICEQLPKSKILCLDHEHIKGYKKMEPTEKRKYVRGLVCFGCNTVFSRFERRKEPRKLLLRVIEYFKVYRMKNDIL